MNEYGKLLAGLDTAHVSDALDRLGMSGQCANIKPLDRSFRVSGRAFTVRYGPVGDDHGTVGDFIDDVTSDQVVVLDNQGRTDATVWGDLLTTTAHLRGVAGTVIDGICRDTDRSFALGYPVFSRGHWMRTGKDRVQVEEIGGPVSIGGVRIAPGDVLLGDCDGVVVIPAARVDQVAGIGREIAEAEARIRQAVELGEDLRTAREAEGYHKLQRLR